MFMCVSLANHMQPPGDDVIIQQLCPAWLCQQQQQLFRSQKKKLACSGQSTVKDSVWRKNKWNNEEQFLAKTLIKPLQKVRHLCKMLIFKFPVHIFVGNWKDRTSHGRKQKKLGRIKEEM
ncbi:UNVERIFIED_CONTAM: hypothetical protein K2H54_013500 [Gekko kuhli]